MLFLRCLRISQHAQFVAEAEKASASKASPRAALLRCADLAEELETKAARLARVQEAAIVPATAAYVTSKQQWKFNDKVRRFCFWDVGVDVGVDVDG